MDGHYEKRMPNKKSQKAGTDDSLGLGNVFGNFRRPDNIQLRQFKTEPVDDDVWQDVQAKEAAALEEAKKKNAAQRPRTQSRTSVPRRQHGGNTTGQRSPSSPHSIVDLTEDMENDISHDKSTTQSSGPRKPESTANKIRVKPLNVIQLQYMDNMQIPDEILNQARSIYNNENILFPPTLRLWGHLKHFVTNQPSSVLNLQLVMMMQAHVFYSSAQPNQTHNHSAHQASVSVPRQLPSSNPTGSPMRHPPDLNTFNGMRQVKVEAEIADLEQRAMLRAPIITSNSSPSNTSTGQNAVMTPVSNNTESQNQIPYGTQHPDRPSLEPGIDPALRELTKPTNIMPDILPADAPASHPHLVNVWDRKLLALPTNVHQHMNLMDTAVSIIARYDLQARSAVEGFLDFAQVHHFFFVFKARDKHFHSWSIEREGNTVTIGIERKNRAIRKLNEAEIESCSSGRIDLSIQFEVTHPPEPRKPNSTSDTDTTSPSSTPPPKLFPKYTLTGSTLLPSTPDLQTFLYETPPTRGADEHAHISHPLQSSLLDPSNTNSEYRHSLSILARYMQHTIFTSRAIDAEIQAVWGRKLRFDTVLGRVRPVWDYALKGAKTQKAKRERGEYNRPTAPPKKSKKKDNADADADRGKKKERSEKPAYPGKGEAKGYLKNSVLSKSARNAMDQVSAQSLVGDEDEQFEPEDDVEAQQIVTSVRDTREERIREPPRKRVKREEADSGSEYSESETYSN